MKKGGSTSKEMLLVEAREIWPQILAYAKIPSSESSLSRVDDFKRWYNIHVRQQQRGGRLAPQEGERREVLIRTAYRDYSDRDVYNLDLKRLL